MALAQQVHAQLALMGVTAIQCPLSNSSDHGNLMHADSIDAMLGEEAPRDLQNALAMLRCVAPFVPLMRPEQLRDAGRPRTIMSFFVHYSHLLTSGQLSATIIHVDNCPYKL